MRILITGASGKVGQALLASLSNSPFAGAEQVALCHRRGLDRFPDVEIVRGSISDRSVVRCALRGVTHVVHLATCKETPDDAMDVAVKGLFWLLEECRAKPDFEQFVLLGGDAAVGHCFYPREIPITEDQAHRPYPGCYALSKVLEEVMLEQSRLQYGLPGCCLRPPWIMEKDDFRYALSFGDDAFGGPRPKDLVGAEAADRHRRAGAVPVLLDADGTPLKRGFVHLDDVVSAILAALADPAAASGHTFHIAMDEPLDYGEVAAHLAATRGLPAVEVPTGCHSVWLDSSKAKQRLGWRPQVDARSLADRAWDYERAEDDPRIVYYPG